MQIFLTKGIFCKNHFCGVPAFFYNLSTGCGKIKDPTTKTAISLKRDVAMILNENFLG